MIKYKIKYKYKKNNYKKVPKINTKLIQKQLYKRKKAHKILIYMMVIKMNKKIKLSHLQNNRNY